MDDRGSPVTESDFVNTLEALSKLSQQPGYVMPTSAAVDGIRVVHDEAVLCNVGTSCRHTYIAAVIGCNWFWQQLRSGRFYGIVSSLSMVENLESCSHEGTDILVLLQN